MSAGRMKGVAVKLGARVCDSDVWTVLPAPAPDLDAESLDCEPLQVAISALGEPAAPELKAIVEAWALYKPRIDALKAALTAFEAAHMTLLYGPAISDNRRAGCAMGGLQRLLHAQIMSQEGQPQ